jgi:di/tricarboxylate transporter
MLSFQEILLIAVIIAALGLIISNRFRADLVALGALITLALTGLVTAEEAISGFSRTAVIVIMGMFVITHALEETGVVRWIAERMKTLGHGSEQRLTLLVMATGALLVLVMNIIAAGAMLLPAVVRAARDSNIRPSKLLIPMSFGTLLGATATYFPTANIVLSGLLVERGLPGLTFVDFFLTGLPIVIAGIVYMLIIGRRLLPDRESVGQAASPTGISSEMRKTYQLDERLWEIRVPSTSSLVNTTLSHSHIGSDLGVTVVAIWRGHRAILAPEPIEVINAGDYLLVMGREERVRGLEQWGLKVGRENGSRSPNGHDYSVDLTEVIIPPRSNAVGKTLAELNFRNKYGLTSVALWREGRSYRTDVGITPLQVGDALLMVGPVAKIKRLAQERDYLLLQSSHIYQPPVPQKAKWALLIMGVVLAGAILNIIPLAVAVLMGWAAVIITGIMSMDDAYRAIEWRVVLLIAGMLPISIAMVNTGLAGHVGSLFVSALAPISPLALIAGLYLLALGITQVVGGQVTSLMIGPIAITAAMQAGVDPRAMAVAVAVACASGFLTPVAHPVNILMMGPGGYKFGDFTRVGVGLTLVVFLMLLVMMVVLWGVG